MIITSQLMYNIYNITLDTGCPVLDDARSKHITTQHDPVKFRAVRL